MEGDWRTLRVCRVHGMWSGRVRKMGAKRHLEVVPRPICQSVRLKVRFEPIWTDAAVREPMHPFSTLQVFAGGKRTSDKPLQHTSQPLEPQSGEHDKQGNKGVEVTRSGFEKQLKRHKH